MAVLKSSEFTNEYSQSILNDPEISNWPVVYILNNEDEAYVGETTNMPNRAFQHRQNPARQGLNRVNVIYDSSFNKSAALDLESFLIRYMSADGQFRLQNGNGGISNHDYYDKDQYENSFIGVWDLLKQHGLVSRTINDIQNSDRFKYSPYKVLTKDQERAIISILFDLSTCIKENRRSCSVISCDAGTGKTVLAVFLLKLLADASTHLSIISDDLENATEFAEIIQPALESVKDLKVGLVIPMQSLRTTLKSVFDDIPGMSKKMVISPNDVPKDRYDLLIVDETHRLQRHWALSLPGNLSFKRNNTKLGIDLESTELDWIKLCSTHQVFLMDPNQSVRPSDILRSDLSELRENATFTYSLSTQLRCRGGNTYIDYIHDIFSSDPPSVKETFAGYDVMIFSDVNEMIEAVKEKDSQFGLCRTVAGYAWKWESQNDAAKYDFVFGDKKYKWNTVSTDWVNSPDSVNEIGCIHTIQGYDLNYTGVIIGNEIKYDPISNEIVVDRDNYFDQRGRSVGDDPDALKKFIINIYYTLLTRGILGTYIYVCDPDLREYMSRFFDVI